VLQQVLQTITPQAARQTDDPLEVLRFATEALNAGYATVLVTLTAIRGGSARPVGAQMAVREDGLYCGVVSGGCVEAAAAHEALAAIREGQDREIIYGKGSPWLDIVLPCGGSITLVLHLLRGADPLTAVLAAVAQRQRAGLRYSPDGTLAQVAPPAATDCHAQGFCILYRPQPRIVLFGRSGAADTTARIAEAAGYDVHICDASRLSATTALIDPDTAVVLLYHDLHQELPLLQAALNAAPFYIGALGSYRTHQQRVATLTRLGYSSAEIARINAPVGIFPKARDASTLALSVLADIAARRQESG